MARPAKKPEHAAKPARAAKAKPERAATKPKFELYEVQAELAREQERWQEEQREQRAGITRKVRSVIWLIMLFVEALIGLRVGLIALAANPNSAFVNFIYDVSYPFVAPFSGLVSDRVINDGSLEISSLVAMAVYFLLGLGLIILAGILIGPTRVSVRR